MRINKYLSETGIISRRGADKWIAEGKVTINGNWLQLVVRLKQETLFAWMEKR